MKDRIETLKKITNAFSIEPSLKEETYILQFKTKVKWLQFSKNSIIKMPYVNEHGQLRNGWATTMTEREIIEITKQHIREKKLKELGI